tara:strand:- start:1836 stop:3164 length:1329 start_codon:yes stop_codon:yes gene_type:complete
LAEFHLDYNVRPYFQDMHDRKQRFGVVVAHRRAGKTVACIYEAVIRALYTPKKNARYAYIAPFFRQAKDVAWVYLKQATSGIAQEVRESELRVILPNGAWITLYGADNPDALRGIYLDGVIVDEIADCRPSLWGEVLLPTLADRRGWAVFIGTVKGKNHFYDMWENAKNDPSWFSLLLKPEDTEVLSNEDLQELQKQMDEPQYAQEFLCDFTAAVKGTFYADQIQQLEAEGKITPRPLYDPDLPVQCAADLGYTDSTAFWFWQEAPDGLRIIDYYQAQGEPLNHYIDMLESKPYNYERVWLPHDARAKTLQTGRSTVEQILETGLPCSITPNLKVLDGINAVRKILPDCHFDLATTHEGVEALRAYKREFNELTKSFRDKPLHNWASDGSDAFRYLAIVCQRGRVEEKPQKKPDFTRKLTLDKLHEEREHGHSKLSVIKRRF